MKRAHRTWHVRAWLVLGPLIVLGLLAGLANRRPLPLDDAAAAEAVRTADSRTEGLP